MVATSTNASNQSRECAACYLTANNPGPGCADEVSACYASPKCKVAFECSVDRGCYQGAREELITCGSSCATEAGFTSLSGPDYELAVKVYACLLGPCRDACFGSDGGVEMNGDAAASEAAAPMEAATTCGSPNATNNELGFGGYCTAISDCTFGAEIRFCAATFGGGNFCTGICSEDSECGTGVHCAHTAQGS
ncbi:MAG TPA: hypothetical protein VGP93_16145, partial [Polyangiaceae bacterium]|nr:hypothetical protein [Polyangiaceae bacterium]